jgi:hypothetical protein
MLCARGSCHDRSARFSIAPISQPVPKPSVCRMCFAIDLCSRFVGACVGVWSDVVCRLTSAVNIHID